jgi:hypothetical protein
MKTVLNRYPIATIVVLCVCLSATASAQPFTQGQSGSALRKAAHGLALAILKFLLDPNGPGFALGEAASD